MKIFCHIPAVCVQPDLDISTQVRDQLRRAIDRKLDLKAFPRDTKTSVVDLEDDLSSWLKERSDTISMAAGRIVGCLLYALYLESNPLSGAPGAQDSTTGHASLMPLDKLRSPQVHCLAEVAPLLLQGGIVASELGTGSGKARIAAHAAAYMLALRDAGALPALPRIDSTSKDDGDTPLFMREYAAKAQAVLVEQLQERAARAVAICAPSIENVVHLVREWSAVQSNLTFATAPKVSIVFGKGQFVSPSKLAQILEEIDQTTEPIEKWLGDGMPAGLTPATRALQGIDNRFCGLMADLHFLANQLDLPALDCEQDEESPESERHTYSELMASAQNADVIFTTHAMLCMDTMFLGSENNKTRKKLPPLIGLIVDEAHTLEANQASVMSKTISGYRMNNILRNSEWKSLRKTSACETAARHLREITETLSCIPEGTIFPISDKADSEVRDAWRIAKEHHFPALTRSLRTVLKGIKLDADLTAAQRRHVLYISRCADALSKLYEDSRGVIGFSPKQRHIQLDIGPMFVQSYIFQRWAVTPMGMLLSGTLLHFGLQGVSTNALRRELAVPLTRLSTTKPLHPTWITESPTLYLPAQQWRHFMPPDLTKSDDELQPWAKTCAKAVLLASSDSKGGVLILTSSYARVQAISNHLRAMDPPISDRLIEQAPSQGVVVCTGRFKSMARAAKRPIWLATGAAGTGLDLSDDTLNETQASEDMLLTDLVITNLPFGLDHSINHIAKMDRIGFGVESVATQRRFRQWLGRLIRREGLLHRRIWVLDGRLFSPINQSLVYEFNRILNGYLNQERFIVADLPSQ